MGGITVDREFFDDPVDHFRFLEASKVLPITRRMLGARFKKFYREYAGGGAGRGRGGHLGDDLAFAAYLEKRLRKERQYPRWVLDLLRYEKSRLRAADPGRHIVLCAFRHDISRLVRGVARKDAPFEVVVRRSVAVWWRPRRGSPVRYAVLTPPHLFRRS